MGTERCPNFRANSERFSGKTGNAWGAGGAEGGMLKFGCPGRKGNPPVEARSEWVWGWRAQPLAAATTGKWLRCL